MIRKTSALWALLAAVTVGTLVGCNQPSGSVKKPDAPAQAPANTTDSK